MKPEQKNHNITIKDLADKIVAIEAWQKKMDEEVGPYMKALESELRSHEDYINKLLTYVEEIDAVTFISLYMNTGKLKAPDTGKISHKRMAQTNALRINGRRALGEYREKERVKELKRQADELNLYHDENTNPDELEKLINSTRSEKIAAELEEKRKKKEYDTAGKDS